MPSILTPIEIMTPPKKYPPIGHCIYRGAYAKNLSKEHVIPFGLAADSLVLPKASCPTCRDITRKHETTVLRSMWWGMRTRIGAPTRHDVPKDFNLHKGVVEEMTLPWIRKAKIGTIKVEPHDFPLSIVAPKYPPPAILVGRDPTANVDWGVWANMNDEEVKKHISKDRDLVGLAPMEPETFGRFIAKVAHGYVVAELGEETFKPALRHWIRNKPMRMLEWIGGQMEEPFPVATPWLHEIQWEVETVNDRKFVVVNLRFFSCFGTPPYRVVVGEFKGAVDCLPFVKQPLYTIDVKTPPPIAQ
jgi:hypothetical protein